MERCKALLPPVPAETTHLPYLGPAWTPVMATLLAEEIFEAIRYLEDPEFLRAAAKKSTAKATPRSGWAPPTTSSSGNGASSSWTAPPRGSPPSSAPPPRQEAVDLVDWNTRRRTSTSSCAARTIDGKTSVPEQLVEAGVQIGWPTRLVPFGPDISGAVFALGFANRAAMAFGGVKPGAASKMLIYNKDRIFAFVNALATSPTSGTPTPPGAINWGFPTIADKDIPQVLPTGICTYEHVVSNVPHDEIGQKAIEVRGLKVAVTKIAIPVSSAPPSRASGSARTTSTWSAAAARPRRSSWSPASAWKKWKTARWRSSARTSPTCPGQDPGTRLPLAMLVEVAGRNFQADFEPILERQIHHLINHAQGIMHIGQRDIAWYRIGKQAVEKGFTPEAHRQIILMPSSTRTSAPSSTSPGQDLHRQGRRWTRLPPRPAKSYHERDARVENMTDETTETYYSCTLCQSFAPNHVCVVSPERTGLCGAYNWLDCKASFEINPTGPNQPIQKGETLDEKLGKWKGVNDFVFKASRQKVENVQLLQPGLRSHDHLRLLRVHRRDPAHVQRHHDRQPGLHRR